MRFEVEGKGKEVVKISLEQDGDDVNIQTNGETYVWFDGESGVLYYNFDALVKLGIGVEEAK